MTNDIPSLKLNLQFTPQQMDYIGNVLGQRPYVEVAQLLADIQQQLREQQRPPVQPLTVDPMAQS